MNNVKQIKPNLVDPLLEKKIIKTLNPPKDNYWAPAKNGLYDFFHNWIRPNIWLVVIIIVLVLFLIYRYRIIKREREIKQLQELYNLQPTVQINDPPKQEIDQYVKSLLAYYNQQKELIREPKSNNGPKLAYPMYPYAQGGALVSSGTRT